MCTMIEGELTTIFEDGSQETFGPGDSFVIPRNTPYTWVNDPHNQLDTYWGVQGLLGRGNPLLVHWAVGKKKKVEVIRSPVQVSEEAIRFQVYNPDTYRLEETSVPRRGSVLIDYAKVYRNGFRDGNRVGLSGPTGKRAPSR